MLIKLSFASYFSASETIAQSSVANTSIITVTATDNDQMNTPNSEIIFDLDDLTLPFMIDSVTGLLSTRLEAPFLLAQVYNIIVIARDNGNPSLTGTGTIIVDVAPPNFHDPLFQDSLTFTIEENSSPAESFPLFQFLVTDDDDGREGQVQLTLLPSPYSNNFSLSSSLFQNGTALGTVFYRGGPSGFDREQLNNFTLPVRATDQGNPRFRRNQTATLFVNVGDVNDNTPVFVGAPYTAVVSENAPDGTSIARAEAVDADEGTNAVVEYSLNYDGGIFRIDSISGNISFYGSEVTNQQRSYSIVIEATDGELSSMTHINVTVLDENDNAPQFSPLLPLTMLLPENTEIQTFLLNISVSDDDIGVNGEVVLSIEQDGLTFDYRAYPQPNEFFIFLNQQVDSEVS